MPEDLIPDTRPTCAANHDGSQKCDHCGETICKDCLIQDGSGMRACAPCFRNYQADFRIADQIKQKEPMQPVRVPDASEKTPWVTLTFCGALVLIYLWSSFPTFAQSREDAMAWTIVSPEAIRDYGEYWRLVTGNFMHLHVMHLFSNVLGMLIFGILLERRIPRRTLIFWMLIAMIGSDIGTIAFHVPLSLGASGIVYGVELGYITYSCKYDILEAHRPAGEVIRSFAIYAILLVAINFNAAGSVDIYAHLGGAMAGFVAALMYPVQRRFGHLDLLALLGMTALFGAWLTVLVLPG